MAQDLPHTLHMLPVTGMVQRQPAVAVWQHWVGVGPVRGRGRGTGVDTKAHCEASHSLQQDADTAVVASLGCIVQRCLDWVVIALGQAPQAGTQLHGRLQQIRGLRRMRIGTRWDVSEEWAGPFVDLQNGSPASGGSQGDSSR